MSVIQDWREQAVKLANTGVMSRREIAEFLGVPRSTCLDYLRAYYKAMAESDSALEEFDKYAFETYPEQERNHRILFISDMHVPYHHPNTLPFLQSLKDRYNPTRIICLGDELDKHALSFHDSDPDLMSAGDELAASLPIIAELKAMFPKMDIIDSNHGSMIYRKAKHHGLPRRYIRSYNEVLGVDEGWVWHNDLTITLPDGQQVYIHHGKSSDAIKTSQAMSMSHVCGHFHESFGVKYWANPNGLFWAMNGGCLIDDKSYAFAYNNTNLKRPIIGTCLIIDGVPILEAMPL
jgi:predicted phosphodiesterase